MQVFCRVKKSLEPEGKNGLELDLNSSEIKLRENGKTYKFDGLFDEDSSNQKLFDKILAPAIQDVFISKKNLLLFSYGITNSGKTFTMIGNDQNPGMLPNALHLLIKIKENFSKEKANNSSLSFDFDKFKILKQDEEEMNLMDFSIFLQSFEIYNDEIYDLSVTPAIANERTKLKLKEIKNKKFEIINLSTTELKDLAQTNNIFFSILANKTQAETLLNKNSSRGHTFFKILLKFVYKSENDTTLVKESAILLIDLAGSERNKRVENYGLNTQMFESCNINKSLLVLGKCINALACTPRKGMSEKKELPSPNKLIPYRESKLTKVLNEYFDLENKIKMIVNISRDNLDFDETVRVLEYSAVAKEIKLGESKITDTSSRNTDLIGKNFELERKLLIEEKDKKIRLLEDIINDLNVKVTTKEQEEKIKNANIELKSEANKILVHEQSTLRDISQPPTYFFFNFSFNNTLPANVSKEEKSTNTVEERTLNKSLQVNADNPIIFEGDSLAVEDKNLKKEVKLKIKLKKIKNKDSNEVEEGVDKENNPINLNVNSKKNNNKQEKLKKPILLEQTIDQDLENVKLNDSSELITVETKETTPILKRLRIRANIKKHYC